MNKRRFYHAVLVLGTVCLLIVGGCGQWRRSERRQESLNRQLIAALVKHDNQQALVFINAGADPNTPLIPLPAPSLRQFWNYLIHRSPLPVNHSPTAFLIACGAWWQQSNNNTRSTTIDGGNQFPLIQSMLQHGANIEAKGLLEWTPLMWAAYHGDPKLVSVLLAQGANSNARSYTGETALYWAVEEAVSRNGSDAKNVISQLCAHGADPNLHAPEGETPLQWAQKNHCSDLVALLKQAGAKK